MELGYGESKNNSNDGINQYLKVLKKSYFELPDLVYINFYAFSTNATPIQRVEDLFKS